MNDRPMLDTPSHLPPQNLEAEEATLGAMLLSTKAIELALDLRLTAEHFYRPSHRTIFQTVLALADTNAVDELTVINALKQRNELADVGGAAAVMTLAERVPAVANAKAYIEEVITTAELRWLVEVGHQIATLGYEHPRSSKELWSEAAELVTMHRGIGADGGMIDADQILDGLMQAWKQRAAAGGKMIGRPTGFYGLDQRLGGLQDGRFYIVAGRPGMGKTSFVLNVAEHLAINEGDHVLFYSYEMDETDLVSKIVSSVAKISTSRLVNTAPIQQDWPLLQDAIQRIKDRAHGRLKIDTRLLSVAGLRTSVRREVRKIRNRGGRVGMVAVDYIQLLESGGREQDRQNEISKISRTLKRLSLELGVPVVALSQLNRKVEDRGDKKPNLSDLRESGSLEQDADAVLLLYRPEYYFPDDPEAEGIAQVIVAKNRRGGTGAETLGFHAAYTKFVNLERDHAA
jgi:replicative DNA helicase